MSRFRRRTGLNPLDMDDRSLVAHLNNSDAMTELIRRHRSRLMALALPMIRNRADAEEIVQDTFVQAFKSADSFRGDAQVSTWLHSICYRQVLTRTRRKRHLTVAIDNTVEPVSPTSADAFRLALDAALDELPDINREAFVLVEMLGFNRAEAAEIVGVEANTMRARVARARSLLADALTDEAPGSP
jgi:RNA polymerase sigma-70 factor (ECF subfamily)